MADDIKRLNYFTNQFLEQTDFQAEQSYHRRMRYLHNQRLHTPGVAYGLAVSKKGDREVTIAEGMAVDADGREIVVLEGGLSYTLTTTELNKSIYLSVAASDVDVDPYKGVGFTDKFTRKAERPKFLETAAFTPNAIVLATLRLDASGKIADVNASPVERRIVTAAIAPSAITLDQLSPSIRPIVSVDGVSNPGGNIDLIPTNAISITPDNVGDRITIGETHSARTDNPHATTAAQVGALPLGGGTLSGRLAVTQDLSVGLFSLPQIAGRVNVAGPSAEFSFVRRSLTSWATTPAAGDRFVWYNQDGNANLFTDGIGDLFTVTSTGSVGIGIAPAGVKLDVGDRIRLRQGSSGSAGLWLFQTTPSEDRAFIGMASDNQVGFYGNKGVGWGLVMDVATGNVGIGTTSPNAKLQVAGGETSLQQEAWQAPTLQNGWVRYSTTYNPPGYFKDSLGIVHLRGLVRAGALKTAIFTLPSGYRPEFRELFSASSNTPGAAVTNDSGYGRVDITSNGEVLAWEGNNGWISLDGITFRAGSRFVISDNVRDLDGSGGVVIR